MNMKSSNLKAYRGEIPGASVYVRVRREDLELLRHFKTTNVLGEPSPKEAEAIIRIDEVLAERGFE